MGDCQDDQGWERDDLRDGYGPIGVVLNRDPRPAPGLPDRRSLASIDSGDGMQLDLHPASSRGPAPGAVGAVTVGLAVDESIELVVSTLQKRSVAFYGAAVDEGQLKLAFFADPDGNGLYLAEPH